LNEENSVIKQIHTMIDFQMVAINPNALIGQIGQIGQRIFGERHGAQFLLPH